MKRLIPILMMVVLGVTNFLYANPAQSCKAMAKVVDRASDGSFTVNGLTLRENGEALVASIKNMLNHHQMATIEATHHLGVAPESGPSPIFSGPEGSQVVYHTGSHERGKYPYSDENYALLHTRLQNLRDLFNNPKEMQRLEKFRSFEASSEVESVIGIKDFIEKGFELPTRDLTRDAEAHKRFKSRVHCTLLSTALGFASGLMSMKLLEAPSKVEEQLAQRVMDTLLASEPTSKAARLKFVDAKALVRQELESVRRSDAYKRFGTVQRNGLLTVDELRRLDEDDKDHRFGRDSGVSSLMALTAAGFATGVFGCKPLARSLRLPGFSRKKVRPADPALAKLTELVHDLKDGSFPVDSKNFTEENLWLDAETPDGTYSTLVLSLRKSIDKGIVASLKGMTFHRPAPEAPASKSGSDFFDSSPFSRASYLAKKPAEKPKAPFEAEVPLKNLEDWLVTHRFTLNVGEEHKDLQSEMRGYFSSAKNLNLSEEEFHVLKKSAERVHSPSEMRFIRYSLEDIQKARERKDGENRKRRDAEAAQLAERKIELEAEKVYVPKFLDSDSLEKVLSALKLEINIPKYTTRKESCYLGEGFPERAEIEAAFDETFALILRMELNAREFGTLKRRFESVIMSDGWWSLEAAEAHIRKELVFINKMRAKKIMGESIGDWNTSAPTIAIPKRKWDNDPQNLSDYHRAHSRSKGHQEIWP